MTLVRIPRARKRGREFFLTKRDLAAFSSALRQAYPDIVFGHMREDRTLRYFDSMEMPGFATTVDGHGHAWRCPAGWEPDWAPRWNGRPDLGYVIANFPDSHFFFRGEVGMGYHHTGAGRKVHVPFLSTVAAVYDQLDPDTRRFIDKVYRLLRKFTTNKFLEIEPDSGRVVRPWSDHFHSAGHDVLYNCRKHDDHFVTANGFDEATGERYFLVPTAEWSPPAWLVALDAAADATGCGQADAAATSPRNASSTQPNRR
jgi:hypothetical protein